MKKIVSIIMAVAVLVLALNIAGCVPPGVSQEEYNKVVAERDEALKKVDTLEGKIEEASKYFEFFAWWMRGPWEKMEPKAMEEYYAEMPEKLKKLGDPEISAAVMEMGKKQEKLAKEMEAKGATEEEIMEALMESGRKYSKPVFTLIMDKIEEALK